MKDKTMIKDFELIPHTADLKIRVYGTTMSDLFKHAIIGMFQAIEPRAQGCHQEQERIVCPQLPVKHSIAVCSTSWESLLVDFLSQALYLSDVHNQAYLDAHVQVQEFSVQATLYGVIVNGFDVEIKAVTYHDMHLVQHDGLWQTDIVFDI